MSYNPLTRRHFLQGLGGSLLALPLLPSLIPRAHAAVLANQKFLVMFGSGHGGTGYNSDWYPEPVLNNLSAPMLTRAKLFNSMGVNDIEHFYRYGRLTDMLTTAPAHAAGDVDNGNARLSFVLGEHLNPFLNKTNFYRGIDAGTFYSGHHRGIYSGNIKQAVNNKTAKEAMEDWPSIDQFLASSGKFYTDPQQISSQVINLSGFSYLTDGTTAATTASRMDRLYQALFNKFKDDQSPQAIAARAQKEFLVDRVYQDYLRFTRGAFGPARRLSSEDKQRVEQHVTYLNEVQTKYKNIINSCSDVTGPNNTLVLRFRRSEPDALNNYVTTMDMRSDLIIAAFQCGGSRLACIGLPEASIHEDYHQSVAHAATTDPVKQLEHNKTFRWQSQHIIANLLKKMDAIPAPAGKTLLDHALVTWTHEAGYTTHHHHSLGLLTFGSLDGFFKTGHYADFRNMDNLGLKKNPTSNSRPGIPIQRFWANIVQGMGYTRAEYERNGRPGYGDSSVRTYNKPTDKYTSGHTAYPEVMMNSLSDRLPIVT